MDPIVFAIGCIVVDTIWSNYTLKLLMVSVEQGVARFQAWVDHVAVDNQTFISLTFEHPLDSDGRLEQEYAKLDLITSHSGLL